MLGHDVRPPEKKKTHTNRDVFYILKFPKSNGIFVPFKKKKLGDESQISGKMNPQPGDSIRVSHGSLEVTVPNVDFGSLNNSKRATKNCQVYDMYHTQTFLQ